MRSSCVALSKIELIQAHKEDDTKRKKVRAMNKMTVAAALAALAVGAAAGWFAASAWREEKCLPAVALAKAGGNV